MKAVVALRLHVHSSRRWKNRPTGGSSRKNGTHSIVDVESRSSLGVPTADCRRTSLLRIALRVLWTAPSAVGAGRDARRSPRDAHVTPTSYVLSADVPLGNGEDRATGLGMSSSVLREPESGSGTHGSPTPRLNGQQRVPRFYDLTALRRCVFAGLASVTGLSTAFCPLDSPGHPAVNPMDGNGSHASAARPLSLSDLTARQREVAELVGLAFPRRQIAARLSRPGRPPMSIRTVDVHIRAIAALLPRDDLPASRRVRKWVNSRLQFESTYVRAV
jgi:DNA-binding CsgD family transcriptional regulator